MSEKLKYVRLRSYDEVIVFPMTIEHSNFKNLNPVSAGFCFIDKNDVKCFGRSFSLNLDSMGDDSFMATKQIHGWEKAFELKKTQE